MNIYNCNHCPKTFSSERGLRSHSLWHDPTYAEKCSKISADAVSNIQQRNMTKLETKKHLYAMNANHCRKCSVVLSYDSRLNRFCSKSCAASYNNASRDSNTFERQKSTLAKTLAAKPKLVPKVKPSKLSKNKGTRKRSSRLQKPTFKNSVVGPYTKLFKLTCKHSNKIFFSRRCTKYSPEYADFYSRNGKGRYKFTFKVKDFPDLLDLTLIEKHGWYSVGGKSTLPINKLGISRDHRVSITEAIKFQYDPYYIIHPLNCKLMLHSENIAKFARSSITYEQLVKLVDEYELSKKTIADPTLGQPS
jgi:hypothetical protein